MFEEYMSELNNIKTQIVKLYSPLKIILFGSLAKKRLHQGSDIDICVVINTNNKRELIQEMQLKINSSISLDIILYTEEEWEQYHSNKSHFAYKIWSEGEEIYGG